MKKASLYIDRHYEIADIDPNIYDSFLEHTCRGIYTGIYEPNHPTADNRGFRGDVLRLARTLQLPGVRYPGGNFVSFFRWEDSVGPVEKRPRRIGANAIETNTIGMHEFAEWCARANTSMMYTVNLGTRGPQEAADCLEYANYPRGTALSDLRIRNGRREPFGIKRWFLGNEQDGAWQIGQKTPVEYGRAANETAKLMRFIDPSIKLAAVGSSGYLEPGFGSWEWQVLNECYDVVDFLSLHRYWGGTNHFSEDLPSFLASGEELDAYIRSAVSICDGVRGKLHRTKRIYISLDEWNVWYHTLKTNGQQSPKAFDPHDTWNYGAEEEYNFVDALVAGTLLNAILRNADRVKMACLAQLINVLAPIHTIPGGDVIIYPTYYPFFYASTLARGKTLYALPAGPVYDCAENEAVPVLDCSVVLRDDGCVVLTLINRDIEDTLCTTVTLREFGCLQSVRFIQLYDDDLFATNTAIDPARVVPHELTPPAIGNDGTVEVLLPKHSWNMMVLEPFSQR